MRFMLLVLVSSTAVGLWIAGKAFEAVSPGSEEVFETRVLPPPEEPPIPTENVEDLPMVLPEIVIVGHRHVTVVATTPKPPPQPTNIPVKLFPCGPWRALMAGSGNVQPLCSHPQGI